MKRFINYSVKIGIAVAIFLLMLLFSAFWYFSAGLPDYKKLSTYQPPVSSRVYAENGKLIAEAKPQKKITKETVKGDKVRADQISIAKKVKNEEAKKIKKLAKKTELKTKKVAVDIKKKPTNKPLTTKKK